MPIILFVFLMAISTVANAQSNCTPNEVRTEIIIKAAPHTIWQILTDVKNYPAWNPYIYEIQGELKLHKSVKFRMKGSPKERKFSAKILAYKPDTTWAWGGSVLFFFSARHYFILERIDNEHTRLIQGEYWHGWFGKSFGKTVYQDACVNFALMNEKLKELAEKK